MADVKWIKLSTDMFDDEKIDFIQSLPEGDSLLVIWVRLLTMAGRCNEGGYIFLTENIPYTEEALSYKFKKSVNIVKLALQTFQNLNMIDINEKGIELINWPKYQSMGGLDKIKEKEQARVRKQKQRDREKQIEEPTKTETISEMGMPCDSHSDVTRDPSIIEEDRDIELELDKELDKELDRERELEGEKKRIFTCTYQQGVDNFNEICKSLPVVTIVDENRKNLINKSVDKLGDIKAFTKVFKKAQDSDFLSGRNEKWQGCSFDWLISEANMIKTLEGNYDNRKSSGSSQLSFNDYEQRTYDYVDLEKKLLGWDKGNDTG